MDNAMSTLAAIVAALVAEDPAQVIVEAGGFWLIDPEFPKDTALHVYYDEASALATFGPGSDFEAEKAAAGAKRNFYAQPGRIYDRPSTGALPTTPIPVRFLD